MRALVSGTRDVVVPKSVRERSMTSHPLAGDGAVVMGRFGREQRAKAHTSPGRETMDPTSGVGRRGRSDAEASRWIKLRAYS